MCMYVTTDNYELLTAKRNIPCYKRLEVVSDSTVRSVRCTEEAGRCVFDYQQGKVTEEVSIDYIRFSTGHWRSVLRFDEGYHSLTEGTDFHNCLFIIPKGAKYVAGGNNRALGAPDAYVASRLIYAGRNTFFNRVWCSLKYGVNFFKNYK